MKNILSRKVQAYKLQTVQVLIPTRSALQSRKVELIELYPLHYHYREELLEREGILYILEK